MSPNLSLGNPPVGQQQGQARSAGCSEGADSLSTAVSFEQVVAQLE